MKTSAVALMFYEGKFLIGKAPNQDRWDIPKGNIGKYESAIDASIREAREETGIKLKAHRMGLTQIAYSIGPISYLKDKQLFINVFKLTKKQAETKLKCTSFFEMHGQSFPEIIEYKWITWSEKNDYLYWSLIKALKIYEYIGEVIKDEN